MQWSDLQDLYEFQVLWLRFFLPFPALSCEAREKSRLCFTFNFESTLAKTRICGLQFLVCGGPSSSLKRLKRAADKAKPRRPSPHSFSALQHRKKSFYREALESCSGSFFRALWYRVAQWDIFKAFFSCAWTGNSTWWMKICRERDSFSFQNGLLRIPMVLHLIKKAAFLHSGKFYTVHGHTILTTNFIIMVTVCQQLLITRLICIQYWPWPWIIKVRYFLSFVSEAITARPRLPREEDDEDADGWMTLW